MIEALFRWVWSEIRHLLSTFLFLFWGYGERPWRLLLSGFALILGFAAFYKFLGEVKMAAGSSERPATFFETTYFSAISFVALGYGNWIRDTNDWARYGGVVEAVIGVTIIALFVTSFTRRYSR